MSDVTVSKLLGEYGEAIRGDWSDVDGRAVRDDMYNLAALVDEFGSGAIPDDRAKEARSNIGVCPHGFGHWTEWCMPGEETEERL